MCATGCNSAARPVRAQLIGAGRCVVDGYTTRGHAPILAMCRQLIAAGYDPRSPLLAYRGDTLALRVRSIGDAAELRVAPHGVGFERLPECTGASLVRQNGSDLSGAGWVDWPPCDGATA